MANGQFHIHGHAIVAKSASAGLHIVSTPIGNLGDITIRALETLASADLILAEDTRVTRKLLSHYGIATPLQSFHEHSGVAAEDSILERLRQGQAVALVSDAGTPLLSDPGSALVARAIAAGIPVTPLPGASALLAALVASGMADGPFQFAGFLPARQTERRQALQKLAALPCLLVFYEAPHRLTEMLRDALALMGDRKALVARELTKRFETLQRGTLSSLLAHYQESEEPRGEMVVLVGPATDEARAGPDMLDEKLREALKKHRIKDASQIVAAELGLAKRQVYARALELQAIWRETPEDEDGADAQAQR